jgi:hypothetical protein
VGYFDMSSTYLPLPSDPRNAGHEPSGDERPPGYWVEIKNELDFGDVNARNKRVVHLQSKGFSSEQADAHWEIDQFSQATLERAILNWNLTKREDMRDIELPVNATNIAHLRHSDATYILAEIMRRNPTETDESGKANGSEAITKLSTVGRGSSRKQRASAG